MVQLLAAAEVGRDVAYFTFGNQELAANLARLHTALIATSACMCMCVCVCVLCVCASNMNFHATNTHTHTHTPHTEVTVGEIFSRMCRFHSVLERSAAGASLFGYIWAFVYPSDTAQADAFTHPDDARDTHSDTPDDAHTEPLDDSLAMSPSALAEIDALEKMMCVHVCSSLVCHLTSHTHIQTQGGARHV
jgi:hypothetical protein